MDRYVLVQNVGTLIDSITAGQHHMEVLALTEEVPPSLFPLLPGPLPSPPPQKTSHFMSRDVPSSLLQLFFTTGLKSFVPSAHMHAHTGYHCGLQVTPILPRVLLY